MNERIKLNVNMRSIGVSIAKYKRRIHSHPMFGLQQCRSLQHLNRKENWEIYSTLRLETRRVFPNEMVCQ
jgi:hypothetical protein